MRSTRRQTHCRKLARIRYRCSFGFKFRSFDPCSRAAHRSIKHTSQRLINHTEHTLPLFGETDLNGEIAIPVNETVGAVECTAHPPPRLSEASLGIDRLFREYSIVGKLAL